MLSEASAPALGQQGRSLLGEREPSSTVATAVFSLWPLFLELLPSSNFCFTLSPFPLLAINNSHLAPCSMLRTCCVIFHLIFGPILAGAGSVPQSQKSEVWE